MYILYTYCMYSLKYSLNYVYSNSRETVVVHSWNIFSIKHIVRFFLIKFEIHKTKVKNHSSFAPFVIMGKPHILSVATVVIIGQFTAITGLHITYTKNNLQRIKINKYLKRKMNK